MTMVDPSRRTPTLGDLVVRGRKPSSPPPNPARTELLAQFYDWVQSSRADIALLTKLAKDIQSFEEAWYDNNHLPLAPRRLREEAQDGQ